MVVGALCKTELIEEKVFSVTIPVQYMSYWTVVNVFDYVYGNPFQQTDKHMKLYQKLCA